jgi:hypothetical protein
MEERKDPNLLPSFLKRDSLRPIPKCHRPVDVAHNPNIVQGEIPVQIAESELLIRVTQPEVELDRTVLQQLAIHSSDLLSVHIRGFLC